MSVVGQYQATREERQLTAGTVEYVSIAMTVCLVVQPILDKCHAVEGLDAFIVPLLGVDRDATQKYIEFRNLREGREGSEEGPS